MQVPGFSTRSLRRGDARSVLEVMAACEVVELGRVDIELADIEGDWARPSLSLENDTLGVFDSKRLVGFSQCYTLDHWIVYVHPDYWARGLGAALAEWTEARASEMGAEQVGQWVVADSASDVFLADHGYEVRAANRSLVIPQGQKMAEPELPEGFLLREAKPLEHRAIYQVIESSMLEWAARERYTFEDYMSVFVNRPGAAPWLNRVAIGPSGAVVGACVMVITGEDEPDKEPGVCVVRFSVSPEFRGLGIGQALLASSFRQARRRNLMGAGISVDSRSPAWHLVDKWGFEAIEHWVLRSKTLAPTDA